jgi:hypothetical protein
MLLTKRSIEESIAAVLCFLLIHNISFVVFPQATTGQIVLVFLGALMIGYKKERAMVLLL